MTAPMSTQQHRGRMQPDDPMYLRLRDRTQKRLSASLQTLVRDLRGASHSEQQSALSAFVARQTQILRDSYIASHQMGAYDYFSEVSQEPETWSAQVTADPERMKRALSFYAPSIAKMANEALGAVNATSEMRLEEAIDRATEESIRLGLFSGFAGRARGGMGGLGHDELPGGRHAIRDMHGHYDGSTRGEHESANIHEHVGAHRSQEGNGGGGALRRLFGRGDGAAPAHDAVGRLGHGAKVEWGQHEVEARGAFKNLFKRALSDQEVASLVGARPGDTVRITSAHASRKANFVRMNLLEDSGGYKAERLISRDGFGKLTMNNADFRMSGSFRTGTGVGTEVFAREVAALTRLGVDHIHTIANGQGSMHIFQHQRQLGEDVGYYVWARLGYNAVIRGLGLGHSTQSHINETPELRDAATIRDIMRTPRVTLSKENADYVGRTHISGREFWQIFGSTWEASFDLAAGSESHKILDAYLTEKGITIDMTDRLSTILLSDAASGHEEIEWTDEDEAAAERAWRKLYPELTPTENDDAMRQDEQDDGETVALGLFSGFSRVTSGMRGALGGVGEDANHTLYSAHGHRFAGRAAGEHQAARVEEHIAAQHHGEGVGGGGQRLARPKGPNEGAHRIGRSPEHVRAIQRLAAAHANPALGAEPRIHELRAGAEAATAAYHAASAATHEAFAQRSAEIRGDLMDHPTARIRDLANRAARAEAAVHGPRAAALEGRMADLRSQLRSDAAVNVAHYTRLMAQINRIGLAQDHRDLARLKAHDMYRTAVSEEAAARLSRDPAYRQAIQRENELDAARQSAVQAHGELRQNFLTARSELFQAQRNLQSIQQHERLGAQRAAHDEAPATQRPFTQEQFVAALPSVSHLSTINTGVNSTGVVKINGRDYIVKRVVMTDSRGDAEAQAAREVVTPELGRLLGVGENMPAATYHMQHEGQDYIVVTRESGIAVQRLSSAVKGEITDHLAEHEVAAQKLLLFEYIVGQGDRHEGNMLYDEHNNRLTEIDFGLEYPHGTALLERSVVGRGLTYNGAISMSGVHIHPEVVAHALAVEPQVIHLLANSLHPHDVGGVEQRYAVLKDLWQEYQNTGEMTMHDWWRIGGDHEDTREVASQPWPSAQSGNWSE